MLAAREMARYHDGSVTAVRDRRCHVWGAARGAFPLSSQYLYFCTSNASKLRCSVTSGGQREERFRCLSQYLHFCTSKASKLRCSMNCATRLGSLVHALQAL